MASFPGPPSHMRKEVCTWEGVSGDEAMCFLCLTMRLCMSEGVFGCMVGCLFGFSVTGIVSHIGRATVKQGCASNSAALESDVEWLTSAFGVAISRVSLPVSNFTSLLCLAIVFHPKRYPSDTSCTLAQT